MELYRSSEKTWSRIFKQTSVYIKILATQEFVSFLLTLLPTIQPDQKWKERERERDRKWLLSQLVLVLSLQGSWFFFLFHFLINVHIHIQKREDDDNDQRRKQQCNVPFYNIKQEYIKQWRRMRTRAEAWPNIIQVLHQYLEKEGKSSSDQENVPKMQRNSSSWIINGRKHTHTQSQEACLHKNTRALPSMANNRTLCMKRRNVLKLRWLLLTKCRQKRGRA